MGRVNEDELATRQRSVGGRRGRCRGRHLVPARLIGSATAGVTVGGMDAQLRRGMCGADAKKFDEVIDPGQAALVIVRGEHAGAGSAGGADR